MTETMRGTAVVTGGTKGLGGGVSLELARAGYEVLALYRRDAAAAGKLDESLSREGLRGRSLQYDVTEGVPDDEFWARTEIVEASSLVLVHNAVAAFSPKPFHLLAWDDFVRAHDVAVRGLWLCASGLLRPMLRMGGGTIVAVLTSGLGDAPPKGFADYLTAKAGQGALLRSLSAEYAGRGLRTLSVRPGFMNTSLTEGWHPALQAAMRKSVSITDPAAVAARILALMDDATLPAAGESYDV